VCLNAEDFDCILKGDVSISTYFVTYVIIAFDAARWKEGVQ